NMLKADCLAATRAQIGRHRYRLIKACPLISKNLNAKMVVCLAFLRAIPGCVPEREGRCRTRILVVDPPSFSCVRVKQCAQELRRPLRQLPFGPDAES